MIEAPAGGHDLGEGKTMPVWLPAGFPWARGPTVDDCLRAALRAERGSSLSLRHLRSAGKVVRRVRVRNAGRQGAKKVNVGDQDLDHVRDRRASQD
jgi:hypothetical protein